MALHLMTLAGAAALAGQRRVESVCQAARVDSMDHRRDSRSPGASSEEEYPSGVSGSGRLVGAAPGRQAPTGERAESKAGRESTKSMAVVRSSMTAGERKNGTGSESNMASSFLSGYTSR